ncbi:hypothetical protein M1L60_27345 [Actinoplanes sp. TRM 88003]|uniref:Integral membrane protein n=1 Tax=Paractinoplanes aksuensis TaxID=2939490 RepID=A0ABT1DTZ3_9ACTN|nr:hypothetical protein [Actinoplanes aksuensis]MCO8274321.1 hypothetical protein [Actinoplanes aksuensis]
MMLSRDAARRFVLPVLAVASAVVWAVGVALFTPPAAEGGNNIYWGRELRWGALLALVLVLITLGRGSRRATWGAAVGGLAGLAVDVGLDRAGYSGGVALAVGAGLVAAAGCAVVRAVADEPDPSVLFTVSIMAAVAAGVATATESPTDVETGLNLGSAAVGSLLALIAVTAAAGRHSAGTTVVIAALAAAAPWVLRLAVPQPSGFRWLAVLALTVLLIGGGYFVTAIALPALFLTFTLVTILLPIGRPFTWLAANPAVQPGDEDLVLIVLAIPVGLILARALRETSLGRGLREAAEQPRVAA